jgi:hypothetical protein
MINEEEALFSDDEREDMNSSIRKQALCGWLKKNNREAFSSQLKMQKYLFFYETLSKMDNDRYELTCLRGYSNGPVFSNVYGDSLYENGEFADSIDRAIQNHPEIVNDNRAKLSSFLVSLMSDTELSEFSHEFNIWNSKKEQIDKKEKNVRLSEKDFNEHDNQLLLSLKDMYPTEYIDSVIVFSILDKVFIIDKEDAKKLKREDKNTFMELAEVNTLINPVYVSVGEDGVILVD